MNNNNRMMDSSAQPFAVDGIPVGRPLTRDDLYKIQSALREFKGALATWERQPASASQPSEQGEGSQSGGPEAPSGNGVGAANETAASESSGPGEGGQPGGSETQSGNGAGAVSKAPASDTTTTQPADGSGPSPEAFHCLILTGFLGKSYGPKQDKTTEEAVAEACARHFSPGRASVAEGYSVEPRAGKIHLILESGGGSLDTAYKVVLFLRSFVKDVHVYVPSRAKSAATLIAIGADRIVMSPYGELGPLDTQITDPRNPATRVSALDCYRSVDYVREFGVQTIPTALKVMLSETQALIPLAQLVESATTFAIGAVKPLLEQIKGLDFGAWGRTLRIGETYAREVRLRLHHPSTEKDAEWLATKLVYGYPHHLYPIDRAEAKELGLSVETMPKDVYTAARAITEACRGESRFVGFSEEVDDAIAQFAEPEDGAPTAALHAAGSVTGNGSPLAYERVSNRSDRVSDE